MANPEGRSGRGLEYDKQGAAKVQQSAKLIETLNNQPEKFWRRRAGETLYVHCVKDKLTVLRRSKDFAEVVAYAEENPKPDAFIVPVPSTEQLRQQRDGIKSGLFE